MSIDSIIYLVEMYWPYLLCGLLIGLLTGWFSIGVRKGG